MATRTLLLDKLASVSFSDRFIAPIDKWTAHSNSYLATPSALPHRAFSIFLFNSRNELLLQRRSSQKRTFPSRWSNTCCSHPNMIAHGNGQIIVEPMREALGRALHRELRIDSALLSLHFANKIVYKQLGESEDFGEYELDYIYLCKVPELQFQPQSQEVSEAVFVKQTDLQQFVQEEGKKGFKVTPWLKQIVDFGMLQSWWKKAEGNLYDEPGEHRGEALNLLLD